MVYRARDPQIDRMVAVKTISIIDEDGGDEPDFRERFFQEARAAGRLAHPGIVTIFDVGQEEDTRTPFIVMEYVRGCSLSDLVRGESRRLPLGAALQLVQSVAEALHYAHSQGVVHRDIKPANILISEQGHAKIADFGVAKLNQSHLTLPARIMGSPAFMSPEQLNGEQVDARADLFSLTVVLYTILAGYRPFQGNSTATVCYKLVNSEPVPLSSIVVEYPAKLDEILARGMAKNPEQRYQSGLELAAAIQELREEQDFEEDASIILSRMVQAVTAQAAKSSAESAFSGARSVPARPAAPRPERPSISGPSGPALAPHHLVISRSWVRAAGLLSAGALLATSVYLFQSHRSHAEPSKAALNSGQPLAQPRAGTASVAGAPADNKMLQIMKDAEGETTQAAPSSTAQNAEAASAPVAPPKPRKAVAHGSLPSRKSEADGDQGVLVVHSIAPGSMGIDIEHPFAEAEASVWIDDRLVFSKELHGESRRKLLLFRQVKGEVSEKISVLPGKHQVKVRIQSAEDHYDESRTTSQSFAPGTLKTLDIKCDKRHNRLEVEVR